MAFSAKVRATDDVKLLTLAGVVSRVRASRTSAHSRSLRSCSQRASFSKTLAPSARTRRTAVFTDCSEPSSTTTSRSRESVSENSALFRAVLRRSVSSWIVGAGEMFSISTATPPRKGATGLRNAGRSMLSPSSRFSIAKAGISRRAVASEEVNSSGGLRSSLSAKLLRTAPSTALAFSAVVLMLNVSEVTPSARGSIGRTSASRRSLSSSPSGAALAIALTRS